MKVELEQQIDRLTRMMGTDEGFYILALHSFVEYFLRYEKNYGEAPSFPELTWQFREELLQKHGEQFIDGLNCLGRLGKQHSYTNKVRHAFEQMDIEEANAATHLFLTFCRLVGIDRVPSLGNLQQHLDLWRERSSPLEKSRVIRHMQAELEKLRLENKSLLAQKQHYDQLKQQLQATRRRLAESDEQIKQKEKVSAHRDEKLDTLRHERHQLLEERNTLLGKLEKFGKLETYLRYLGRLSIYTRTRMDYEHTISRLTPEQEEAVQAVKLKGHFLIRGGAGTGKSLVLLESLRRAALQNELQFGPGEQAVLVTFTRTLAKYNRYITELRNMKVPIDVIDTIDSIFYTQLKQFVPDLKYDFSFLQSYLQEQPHPDFISPEELQAEIEEFIFALGLNQTEYVKTTVSRKGMRRRLTEAQRAEVWNIAVETALEMRRRRIYTKNYGRLVLLRRLEAQEHSQEGTYTAVENPAPTTIPAAPSGEFTPTTIPAWSQAGPSSGSPPPQTAHIRYLFLDEVQDLTPVALKALRKLTRGPMIMAGDMGQSLYVYYSPFFRSGIDLRGTTKVLHTNFRNTRQIHELASRFRSSSSSSSSSSRGSGSGKNSGQAADGEPSIAAVFREGPAPELYTADTEQELLGDLQQKTTLFIDEMGYDPENLCILVPRRKELTIVEGALAEAGISCEDIRSEEFSFRSGGKVRISTLHSSKGLDFPVVMLYLPYLHRRPYYNNEETEKLLRNLTFVGLTRAMDNLNVFMIENGDPVLQDLQQSFQQE